MHTISRRTISLLFLSTCLFATACSSTGNKAHDTSSNSESDGLLYSNHPLAGKIWSIKQQQFVTTPELVKQLAQSDYILLGETHDNIVHHQHEAWVIKQLAGLNINAGVSFEMIDDKQGKELDKAQVKNAAQLVSLLEKDRTGWDYKKDYRPVFDRVYAAGFPIFSANINRNNLMMMLGPDEKRVPEKIKQQLAANPLSDKQKAHMAKEIAASHCGMSTPTMTNAMILGQNLRNATMSNSLYKHKLQGLNTMVLIAGSGHVRNDRGVPHYLHASDQSARIVTIAWLEVDKGANDVKDYAKAWGETTLPFDYVWFTPQAKRPDPCEEMRKFMEQHRHGHKQTPLTKSI